MLPVHDEEGRGQYDANKCIKIAIETQLLSYIANSTGGTSMSAFVSYDRGGVERDRDPNETMRWRRYYGE